VHLFLILLLQPAAYKIIFIEKLAIEYAHHSLLTGK